MIDLPLFLAPLFCAAAAAVGGDPGPRPALEIHGRNDARVEHFVITPPRVRAMGPPVEASAGPRTADAPIGVARLVATAPVGEGSLELTIELFDIDTRVTEFQRRSGAGLRYVFREVFPEGGRTVVVEEDAADGALRSTDWFRGAQAVRAELPGGGGVALRLGLAERARAGANIPAQTTLFDPLAGRVVDVRTSVEELSIADFSLLRRVRLHRPDGTSLGSWVFVGRALVALSHQDGGPVARRVSETTWKRAVAARAPLEAMPTEPLAPR